MKKGLIAPCGMNCNLCIAHLREKKRCLGCGAGNDNKSNSCIKCYIKNCRIMKNNSWKYCSKKCSKFPCLRLKNLDKRYKSKYMMSMLENLEIIDKKGITKFLEGERRRWIRRGKVFCVHNKRYYP